MGFLTYRDEGKAPVCHSLRKRITIIGRHSDCDIVLNSQSVSRSHAEIRFLNERFVLNDLASSNGVLVNGQLRSGVVLNEGDQIQIGDFIITFTAAPAEVAVEIPDSPPVMAELVMDDSPTLTASSDSLQRMVSVLGKLAATLDVDALPKTLAHGLMELLPNAGRALVLLRDDVVSELSVAAAAGQRARTNTEFSLSIAHRALATGKAILCMDAGDDERFETSNSIDALNIHSVICAPLIGSKVPFGVVYLDRQDLDLQFNHLDLEVLATIAAYAANSLENTRLHQSLTEAHDELEKRVAERTLELRASNESLRDAISQRDEFLAMLSHELRNPLAAMSSATMLLERAPAGSDAFKSYLEMTQKQTNQMASLLDDLLDVSRVTKGAITLSRRAVDFGEILVEAISAATLGQGTKLSMYVGDGGENSQGCQVVSDIPDKPVWVHGDSTRLQQICINLIVNAAKYSPRGGRIWVTLRKKGRNAELTVRDEGAGISPDQLKRIFDMFYQSDVTIDRSQGGMGVGLTLTERIVSLHDGSVAAHSEGEGKGAEFVVKLPILPMKDSPEEDEEQNWDRPQSIVLIEDQAVVRDTLSAVLTMDGYRVETADCGEKGIRLIEKMKPDVALVDIGLPGLNGFEVLEHLQRNHYDGSTRMIALTGYDCGETDCELLRAGFDDHVVKPLNLELLAQIFSQPARDGHCSARKRWSVTR